MKISSSPPQLTYKNMESFMCDYYQKYNDYVNNAKTVDKLDELYTKDFAVTTYAHVEGQEYPHVIRGREEWINFCRLLHRKQREIITPLDISIDDKKKTAVVLLTIEMTNVETKEQTACQQGLGSYKLCIDNGVIKVKSIDIFFDRTPPITFDRKEYKKGNRMQKK